MKWRIQSKIYVCVYVSNQGAFSQRSITLLTLFLPGQSWHRFSCFFHSGQSGHRFWCRRSGVHMADSDDNCFTVDMGGNTSTIIHCRKQSMHCKVCITFLRKPWELDPFKGFLSCALELVFALCSLSDNALFCMKIGMMWTHRLMIPSMVGPWQSKLTTCW